MSDLGLAARAALILVFAVAAYGKLVDRGALAGVMRAMGVPAIPAAVVAAAELACVTLLVLAPAAGFALALALLAAFTAGLVNAIRRGAHIACRCFGASTAPIGKSHIVRNALLVALAGLGLVMPQTASIAAGAAGALLGLAIVMWDELVLAFR
ncbi:MAG: methylamine utilization protein MauE [Kofleriaceae bacterium]|nr:methylamine utilization protein MauE [Kofleriaceae bacterium]